MIRLHLVITDLQIGGTPRVVRELATRLRPYGFDTRVTCLAPWGPVADEIRAAGVPVSAVGLTSTTQLPAAVKAVRAATADADVIFSLLVHANVVSALANAGRTTPLIQSVQTTQPRPAWHWWAQAWAARLAVKLIVPSPSAAAAAHGRSGVPTEKTVVIPNAVDMPALCRTPRGDGPWRVGFLGRLDPVKRVPDLVRAIELLPGVRLDIFGDGPERPTILGVTNRLGLADRVTLYGTVASAADALAAIDTLVLPSAAEGFGLVLIEAMAAGVPVIGTDVPGIRDVVVGGVNGLLVPVNDPAALANAIGRIREDASLAQRLVRGGGETVGMRYAWEAVLPAYAAAFNRCVSSTSAEGRSSP